MELKIAQIQMPVTADREENIRCACDMVRQAGDIDMAVLPEMFCCPYDNVCFRPYGEAEGGPAYRALSALARERGIWLVGGTLPELAEDRVYNTCYVFAPDGQLAAKHRKMHLFDIDVAGGQRFMESETLTAGNSVTTFETPWGVVGVCVCFDFRFTELSELMVLAGAKLVVVPAAFNMTTGPAHWELLFRQRAVDGHRGHLSGAGYGGGLCGMGPLHRVRPLGNGGAAMRRNAPDRRHHAGYGTGGGCPAAAADPFRPADGRIRAAEKIVLLSNI